MPQRVPQDFTSTTLYDNRNDISACKYTHNERQVTSKRPYRTDIKHQNDIFKL